MKTKIFLVFIVSLMTAAANAQLVEGPPMGNFRDAIYVNFETFTSSGWTRRNPTSLKSVSFAAREPALQTQTLYQKVFTGSEEQNVSLQDGDMAYAPTAGKADSLHREVFLEHRVPVQNSGEEERILYRWLPPLAGGPTMLSTRAWSPGSEMPWHIVVHQNEVLVGITYKGQIKTDAKGGESTVFRIVVTLDGKSIADTGEKVVDGRLSYLPVRPLFLAPCLTGDFVLSVEGNADVKASYHQKALHFNKNFPTGRRSGPRMIGFQNELVWQIGDRKYPATGASWKIEILDSEGPLLAVLPNTWMGQDQAKGRGAAVAALWSPAAIASEGAFYLDSYGAKHPCVKETNVQRIVTYRATAEAPSYAELGLQYPATYGSLQERAIITHTGIDLLDEGVQINASAMDISSRGLEPEWTVQIISVRTDEVVRLFDDAILRELDRSPSPYLLDFTWDGRDQEGRELDLYDHSARIMARFCPAASKR